MITVNAMPVEILAEDVRRLLALRECEMEDCQVLYYPYYYLRARVRTRILSRKVDLSMYCAVDLNQGAEALLDDAPRTVARSVPPDQVVGQKLSSSEAREKAGRYLLSYLSHRLKVLQVPSLEIEEEGVYHRPFWVVSYRAKVGRAALVVDGISGAFHSLV